MADDLSLVRGKRLRNQFMTPVFWAFAGACSFMMIRQLVIILKCGGTVAAYPLSFHRVTAVVPALLMSIRKAVNISLSKPSTPLEGS